MTNKTEVLVLDELDFKFGEEIASQPGGENIKRCFACGTCSASCPITEIDERYNPRKIIRMALLGMKREVLSSDFIWICSNCYLCYERCPQGPVPIYSLRREEKSFCTLGPDKE